MDLTDETQFEMVTSRAEQLAAVSDLDALEQRMASEQASHPLTEHLAVKLARSRRVVPVSCHLSVVCAVYREHQRILTRAEHPHGENFLRRKMAELDWLLPGRWDLTIVDDGCPAGSGRLARQIVESARAQDRVRVLSLDEAIRQGHPAARSLSSAADSQKGGAVHYGLWTAAQQSLHDHVVLFTDADLSTHLGQAGLLLDPILNGGMDAAIGSRREPTSVVVKQGLRNVRGKLFIYLWKRLLPQLQDVVDTQCGFKAFRAEVLPAILQNTIEKRFACYCEPNSDAPARSSVCPSPGSTARRPRPPPRPDPIYRC